MTKMTFNNYGDFLGFVNCEKCKYALFHKIAKYAIKKGNHYHIIYTNFDNGKPMRKFSLLRGY